MNDGPTWHIERLADHDRTAFNCGVAALDTYFRTQATQDIRRRMASCFVAVNGTNVIGGFYTLAAASIPLLDLPPDLARRLPRYPSIPAYRLGRLAVDIRVRGQKLGATLLADALIRVMHADVAAYALLVDAKDETAAAFYAHHGFTAFADRPLSLFLPLATAAAAR